MTQSASRHNKSSALSLEVAVPLPEAAAVGNSGSLFQPILRRNLFFTARDTALSVSLLRLVKSDRAAAAGIAALEDIPLGLDEPVKPDITPSGLTWKKELLGRISGGYLFQVRLSYVPGKNDKPVTRIVFQIRGADSKQIHPPLPPLLESRLAAAPGRTASDQSGTLSSLSTAAPRLKIWVSKEGIVRIPALVIKAAGLAPDGFDPRRLSVISRGREIPIQVAGEEDGVLDTRDAVEFFAEPPWEWEDASQDRKHLDIYSNCNIYWLEAGEGPGLRFGQESASEGEVDWSELRYPRSTPFPLHVERDGAFHRLNYTQGVAPADHWVYSGGISGGEKREFSFKLAAPDEYALTPFRVRLKLRGISETGTLNRVDVFVNEVLVGSGEWRNNQQLFLVSEEASAAFLKEGTNQLTIVNHSSDGALSQLFLDWFDVEYPHLLEAGDDYLEFRPPANSLGMVSRFEIGGFSNPDIEIFKLSSSRIFKPDITPVTDSTNTTTYTVHFDDRITNACGRYLAFTSKAVFAPDTMALVPPSDLRQRSLGADYIVIYPSDSLGAEPLAPLLDLRRSQGHQIVLALLEDIYNEFNNGQPNPRAIREYLRYCYEHRSDTLQYVLLVGDGTINQRLTPAEGNQIPVYFYQTVKYGAAPSDHWYVLLEGDDYNPDMAIGRLPVKNREDLELMVGKTVSYETAPPAAWNNRCLLIGAGGYNSAFQSQSETLIREVLPPLFHPERLYLAGDPSDPNVGGTTDLLRHLEDGMALVNFRGHGGGAVWADAGLLDLDDVGLIQNRDRLPFITSMTCFTGDFSGGRTCLAEALLLDSPHGAVALWGSTGLGWVYNDYVLITEFYRELSRNPRAPLGALLAAAKRDYLSETWGDLAWTDVHQYTLLGDPALRLALPSDTLDITLEKRSLAQGDSLRIEVPSSASGSSARAEVFRPDRQTVNSTDFESLPTSGDIDIPLPEDFDLQRAGFRIHVWNQNSGYQAHGFSLFSLGVTFFDSVRTIPAEPQGGDSLHFAAIIENGAGIDRAWCRLISPVPDSLEMVPGSVSGRYRTLKAAGPFNPGVEIVYAIGILGGQGDISSSDTLRLHLPGAADLRINAVSFGGISAPQLEAVIYNSGEAPAGKALVLFADSSASLLGTDTVNVAGYSQTVSTIQLTPQSPQPLSLRVTVNPDSSLTESNYGNNSWIGMLQPDHFLVTPQEGSGPADRAGLPGRVMIHIPPEAVPQATVLRVQRGRGGDLGLGSAVEAANDTLFFLDLPGLDDPVSLTEEAQLAFSLDPGDSSTALRLYRWEAERRTWLAQPGTGQDGLLTVNSAILGYFRLGSSDDTAPPGINIEVRRQSFTTGSFTSLRPAFLITLSDSSGLDLSPGRLRLFLDEIEVAETDYAVPDSLTDPERVTVIYQPELEAGQHSLEVEAADVHGNSTRSDAITFRAGDTLEIHFLGNHPNPFVTTTIFSYILTSEALETTLKIYTVSGTLIRTFANVEMNGADYHEIFWDGRDEWGEDTANGVYFFQLRARSREGWQEVTGKLAKLR